MGLTCRSVVSVTPSVKNKGPDLRLMRVKEGTIYKQIQHIKDQGQSLKEKGRFLCEMWSQFEMQELGNSEDRGRKTFQSTRLIIIWFFLTAEEKQSTMFQESRTTQWGQIEETLGLVVSWEWKPSLWQVTGPEA